MNKIIIITGKVDSGKTTLAKRLIKDYQEKGKTTAGIICEAIKKNNIKSAYYAVDIASHKKNLLASIDKIEHGFKFRKFYFSYSGFEFAIKALRNAINAHVIILDEIGYLELEKKGFYEISLWLIKNYKGILILVVRKNILDNVLALLGLHIEDIELKVVG